MTSSSPVSAPEIVADVPCVCGENPYWVAGERKLYWTDIPKNKLYRYDPATNKHEIAFESDLPIGGFTLQADGSLLLFMGRGRIATWRDGRIEKVIVPELPDEIESRFNDVIADPRGRVFCGTMSQPKRKGRLYRMDTDGKITLILENIGCSNGMGFTADRKTMYYVDSLAHEVYQFDYDENTGAITNQRVLIKLPDSAGLPDGMTVDAQGDLWLGVWDGSCLLRFDAGGREKARYPFPARKITSLTFGGDDFTDIYATSGGGDKRETDGAAAGSLFRSRLGFKGIEEFVSRIGL